MTQQSSTNTGLDKDKLLAVARDVINKWISIHVDSYLVQVGRQLIDMAEKADNNQDQTRLFQARLVLEESAHNIQQNYMQGVDKAFKHFLNNEPTASDLTAVIDEAKEADQLSLVNNSELEEKISLASMSQKASVNASEDLYSLHQRLSVLMGGVNISEHNSPVSPAVFCEILQETLAPLELDTYSKLIVYKIFDSHFMAKTAKLYNLLNNNLESQGVLTNLGYQVKKSPGLDLPEELQEFESPESAKQQIELYEAIQALQNNLRKTMPPRTVPPISLTELISSIQQMQSQAGSQLSDLDTPQSVAASNVRSINTKAKKDGRKGEDIDAEIVEIVGLLFEYMLNDEQLPDSVKTLLSYLHTPFIKVGLLDKDFFNHPQHPARQLLNALVAAGERWVEPQGKHKNDVFLKIKAIIQKVLDEFDNDVRFFSELAFDFNQYLRQHARRIRLAEKRALQAAKGESKLKEMRLKVEGYLNKKTDGLELPQAIRTLLYEPWANFLCFNLLRFGSSSRQWHQATRIVDEVIWYSLISQEWHDTKRVNELKHSLPEALQAGFEVVGYDKNQSIELIVAIHECHQKLAQSERSPFLPARPTEEIDIDSIRVTDQLSDEVLNDPLLRKLTALDSGTWFIFNADDPKQERRVKLAWSDTNTLNFMFVNRMGQQIAVKTATELMEGIRAGNTKVLRVLEGKPFFEKALENALGQLKKIQ